jgi:8-oxo-dGTP diphosphatase
MGLEVVAAVIVHGDEILCMQRNSSKYEYMSYKYEFPGGKVEDGEAYTRALERELREELDLDVHVDDKDHFMTVIHSYPDFTVRMHSYLCRVPHKIFMRKEHIDHKWLRKDELDELDWASADLPIVERIKALGSLD